MIHAPTSSHSRSEHTRVLGLLLSFPEVAEDYGVLSAAMNLRSAVPLPGTWHLSCSRRVEGHGQLDVFSAELALRRSLRIGILHIRNHGARSTTRQCEGWPSNGFALFSVAGKTKSF